MQQSIRARMAFKARRNSGLIKQLQDVGNGRSRFASILNDGVATTLHSCVQLPPQGKHVFEPAAQLLMLMSTEKSDSKIVNAMQTLANATSTLSEQNCLEFILKIGWRNSAMA
jgi:hypothetical protein